MARGEQRAQRLPFLDSTSLPFLSLRVPSPPFPSLHFTSRHVTPLRLAGEGGDGSSVLKDAPPKSGKRLAEGDQSPSLSRLDGSSLGMLEERIEARIRNLE